MLRPVFCRRVPPSPPYRRVEVPRKTSTEVNPSFIFTPKFASRSAITGGSLAGLGRTEVPLQTPLNHNSWPFSRRSQPLQNRGGNLPKRRPETRFPEGHPPPDPQSGNVVGETRTLPGSGDTQSAPRETEPTSENGLKSSTLRTKE